jgi:hypothetical protein
VRRAPPFCGPPDLAATWHHSTTFSVYAASALLIRRSGSESLAGHGPESPLTC